MPALKFEITGNCEQLIKSLGQAQGAFAKTAKVAEEQGQAIDGLLDKLKNTAAMIGVGFGIKEFGTKVMQVRGQFQQLEMAFKTMLQSGTKANDLMNQLVRTAATTPFDLQGVANGAKQLLAYGTAAEDVNTTLVRLGDIAAGLSIPLNDLVWLYGTTMTQGRMFTQDLRQFQGRGIPIAEEIAKIKGVAVDAVGELVTAGKVTSDVVKQAIENMTAEGSKFGGLMEAQSKTITGQISNIEDSIDMMFNSIGQKSEGVINEALSGVSYLVENWESVGKVVLTVATAFGTYKAALLAVIAAQKVATFIKSAEAFFSLAKGISSAKEAMLLFNIATNANPIGAIIGLIASAAAAFAFFGDSTDEAIERQEKFGESADRASDKVESLFAVLQSASKQSKVHKDALNELKNVADEYGITLNKEGDLTDQLIEKKETLIGVIREEAIERQRANDITDASETYQQKMQEIKDNIKDSLSDDFSDMQKSQLLTLISEEDIKKITDAYNAMLEAEKKSIAMTGTYNSRFSNEQIGKYNQSIQELADKIGVYSKALGVSARATNLAEQTIKENGLTLAKTRKEYDTTVDAVNQAAAAAQSAEMATDGLSESQRNFSDKTKMAKESVSDLAAEIKSIIDTYNNAHINLQISYEELNTPPAWMEGVSKRLSSDKLKNLAAYHQARANQMRNHKQQTGKNLVMQNGKGAYTNEREEQVMAGQYSILAKQKETEENNARRAAEEAKKKNAKSAASEAKRRANEAKKKAEDQKKAQEELNEDLLELQQKNTDETISLMQEGTEKKIAEIKNDYAKRKAEIDKQEAEFKKKNKEAGKKVILTSAQTNALNKARDLATQEYNKKLDEVNREALTSMRDYLKEYGSLYQQKQAIAEEYEEKIAKAQTEGEKKTLQQEKKKALSNFDYESISMGIDWKGLMSGVGNMSKEMLKPMLEKLYAYTNTDKFQQADTQTQQKVVDLMQEIRTYLGTDQNATWQNLAASISSFNQSVAEYQKAVEEEKRQSKNFKSAKALHDKGSISDKELQQAKKATDDASQAVVDAKNKMNTFGIKLNSATEAVTNYTSGLTAALNKLGTWKGSEGFSEVQSSVGNIDALKGVLDESLSTMGNGVAKTMGATISKGLGSALDTIGGGITNMMGSALGSIVGVVAQIPKLILNLASSIKSFVTGILDSFTQLLQFEWLSDLVDSILGAVGNLIDAIFDLPENLFKAIESIVVNGVGGLLDNVLGRVGNILSLGALSSKGPSDWFTNSNAEKVQKTINRLTSSNEQLQKSIDKLKDTMTGTYGKESTNAYKEAKRQQETYNHNVMEIAKQQMSYHGSHHSWSSYWSGFNDEQMKLIREKVKSDFNGDLTSLTPEEMKKLLSYQELVYKIRDTGAHYKGRSAYGEAVLDKLEDYADLAGNLDELTEQWRESITQISFDSMKDNFISNLMDMSKSAHDFSDDFAEMMQKALLSFSMEDLINGDLKKLYEDWADAIDAANGDSSKIDIDAFNKRYDDIVQEGLKRRDEWAKVTGYTGSSSSSQTATSGGWASMGQDTADELNGRFTALQIAGESIKDNTDIITNAMNILASKADESNTIVTDVRNLLIYTNSYLEDIKKYNKLIYEQFGSKIDDMNRRLKEM